jgi:hypothetical protein
MRGRSLALSFLLIAGGAAACSDDGGTDAQPYVDALTEELEGDDMTADQAECMAEQTIDAIGADFLADNDIEPEDLAGSDGPQDLDIEISEEQASGAAEAFVDCDISFADGLLGLDASDEAVACVEDNLDEDVIVDALTAEYLGDSEESEEIFGEAFATLQTECAEFLGG